MWNKKFELTNGSYSVSETSDYFEYIIKKQETMTDNASIRIHVKLIENKIPFKSKTGYYLEFLTPETMKLLGSTKNKIAKDKNGKNLLHLDIIEVIVVNNDYQQDLKVQFTLVPNSTFGKLLDISPKILYF